MNKEFNRILKCKHVKEIELLLCCARTTVTKEVKEKIKELLKDDIDWEFILTTATKNEILPLLYKSLKEIEPNFVSPDILNNLRTYYIKNARYNMIRSNRLIQIWNIIYSNGITAAAFKGPVLAEKVYGDIGLRFFSDIDILVAKNQVPEARKLIEESGYTLSNEIPVHRKNDYIKIHIHDEFIHQDSHTFLELHWALTRWHYVSAIETDYLLSRAEPVTLFNSNILTLNPEDFFLVLSLHAARHRWDSLKWICDIAEFIRVNPEFNWDHLIVRARDFGMKRMVLLGFFLAHNLLDATLPENIVENIKSDRVVKKLSCKIYEELFREKKYSIHILGNPLFQFLLKERLKDKLRYTLRSVAFPSKEDWLLYNLPKWLSFFYYFTRPIRMLHKNLIKNSFEN